jgi:RNA-directed DNA polymerase
VTIDGSASDKQCKLSAETQDETVDCVREAFDPVGVHLMERMLERDNLKRALNKVRSNKGAPGIDGMTVDELPGYLKLHWSCIREQLLSGIYRPLPVRTVLIPKGAGAVRRLGVPTVLDRFIQQALLQVLQSEWDQTFSHSSYGFRPKRSAHQAVACAQGYLRAGYRWVVDLDLEKFFDMVNHDALMHRVRRRVTDVRVLGLIERTLRSGAMQAGALSATTRGTPQGGPLSPLLANVLLDELDRELERRGHRFVRYADDCNIYVRSRRAGERVLGSVRGFIGKWLKLKVNELKSAVDRPWRRRILGFTFTSSRGYRLSVSAKSIDALKSTVRDLTQRTRGRALKQIIDELRMTLLGWKAYFGRAEVISPLRELDQWIRRRLRCYQWKQWGSRGYRALRALGVSRELAWNTAKSAHGPWRLSRSPALSYAMPSEYFAGLGLPTLARSVAQ